MEVLQFTRVDVDEIRKYFGVDHDRVERDLKLLTKWMSEQKHLPRSPDPGFLAYLHLRCKFRVELTKRKIEHYFTLRGLYREFFQEHNEEIIPTKEVFTILPMSRLAPDHTRVIVAAFRNKDPRAFSFNRLIKFIALMLEIIHYNEYSLGDKWLVDLSGFSLEHIWKIGVRQIFRSMNMFKKAYTIRPVQIEIVNASEHADLLMSILKINLPKKIFQRIRIHKNLKDVHQYIPVEYLPEDYGGRLKSVDNLLSVWDQLFVEKMQFLNRNYNRVSKEADRVGEIPSSCCYGMEEVYRNREVVEQSV